MPNATVDVTHFERVELKSLPEAYIMVRPLPYGQKLNRRQKATKMWMEAHPGKKESQADADTQRFELETLNMWSTLFDFAYCIGEHNLTDAAGNLLDLSKEMVLNALNPKVGDEIEKIVNSYNEDTDEEDFTPLVTSSSQNGATTS